ncbi:YncE family protein [Phenylobacterium sp.]|uniref:YncE family protein n=1 Tax=Phenylobacterium sp. TaxID=1871053 RepID=UPI00301D67F6
MMLRPAGLAVAAALFALPALAAPTVEKSVKLAPGNLYEIVFNSADGDLYVAAVGPRSAGAPKIVRVDSANLASEAEFELDGVGLFGLGLNSRTQTLWGTATLAGSVSAIDLKTGKVVASVKAGEKAHVREAIVDEQRDRIYVTVVGGLADKAAENPNQVWVIDGATRKLDRIITVPTGQLTGAALDATGERLFVTGMGAHEVLAIDLATDKVVGRWPAGGQRPTNIVYDPSTRRLFTANQGTGDMSVLDAATGDVVKVVKTGAGALSVALNPANGQVYVANRQAGTVTVIDSRTLEVLADLKTGTFPQTIAIDRKTGRVFVTNKARGLPRNAPAGTPVPDDPDGDTITLIRP